MIRAGIIGAAGYTGGELIRLLVNHPEAEITFAHSESNAGNPISLVHEGLTGDTDMCFSSDMPLESVDVVFFCQGHGKSEEFLSRHHIPAGVKVIDFAQDFRIGKRHIPRNEDPSARPQDFVYGLPEINLAQIKKAQRVANPGCFATCIQLALLPLVASKLIGHDVCVNALTGSTGAGQKPSATTHYSWRAANVSVYKPLAHQHLHEICQTFNEVNAGDEPLFADKLADPKAEGLSIDFVPLRGPFARGIFATAVAEIKERDILENLADLYQEFYRHSLFTNCSPEPVDLKQVVNTNKALVHVDTAAGKAVVTCVLDNLLKGASGQAVENMNLMFGLPQDTGLRLKALAF